MTKIEQLEARIKSLNDQVDRIRARLGDGPHVDALVSGTKMAVEEIEERLSCLRSGLPDPYEN